MLLREDFYIHDDVIGISRELLGKVLYSCIDGIVTSGIITETEAYAGITDRASHAFGGKRTARTEVMFGRGGTAYVYLCYGVHSLFNVVTSVEGNPHAVLVRAIKPLDGIETMKTRSGKEKIGTREGTGPGNVCKLLGIHFSQSGWPLVHLDGRPGNNAVWIEDRGYEIDPASIVSGPRIGVDYAGEDALLPYRFRITI
jgi:DNA-3-methyladenine glycosylase